MEPVRQLRPRSTRRTVVKTGAKLAYAAPLVAASFRLGAGGALAAGGCACKSAGFVFDDSPPLDGNSNPTGFSPACCTCKHCTFLGATNPVYDPATNQCFDGGQPITSGCYPLCDDVCRPVSPP
jgi:hypothetical protein